MDQTYHFSLKSAGLSFLSGLGYIVGSEVDHVAKDWHWALRVCQQHQTIYCLSVSGWFTKYMLAAFTTKSHLEIKYDNGSL